MRSDVEGLVVVRGIKSVDYKYKTNRVCKEYRRKDGQRLEVKKGGE